MIIENPDEKKELDNIPDVDENGDPIYKIDAEDQTEDPVGETAVIAEKSEFLDTLQDLKDETSQD